MKAVSNGKVMLKVSQGLFLKPRYDCTVTTTTSEIMTTSSQKHQHISKYQHLANNICKVLLNLKLLLLVEHKIPTMMEVSLSFLQA